MNITLLVTKVIPLASLPLPDTKYVILSILSRYQPHLLQSMHILYGTSLTLMQKYFRPQVTTFHFSYVG